MDNETKTEQNESLVAKFNQLVRNTPYLHVKNFTGE